MRFFVLVFVSNLLIGLLAYNFGYDKAKLTLSKDWFEGPEGYCLAQNHPGECANVKSYH